MITKNNWVHSNIVDVADGNDDTFRVYFQPYRFVPMSFQNAADYTACLIEKNFGTDGLYLGLSGGADSEFIARLFKNLNILFTPIVVMSELNNEDIINAMQICEELDLKPIIVRTTEQEIIEYYFKYFFFKRNEGITHVHQMLVADKAKELGGWAVLGETHIYDPNPQQSIVKAFKFVPDLYDAKIIPFYYYTLELTYAEMKEVKMYHVMEWPETAQKFKARVRGTKLRTYKSLPKYKDNQEYHYAVKLLKRSWLQCDLGTPEQFTHHMEKLYEI